MLNVDEIDTLKTHTSARAIQSNEGPCFSALKTVQVGKDAQVKSILNLMSNCAFVSHAVVA